MKGAYKQKYCSAQPLEKHFTFSHILDFYISCFSKTQMEQKQHLERKKWKRALVFSVLYILILIFIFDLNTFDLHFYTDKDRMQEMNITG